MDYRARVLKAEGGDMLDLPGHKVTAKTVGEARVELRRRGRTVPAGGAVRGELQPERLPPRAVVLRGVGGGAG